MKTTSTLLQSLALSACLAACLGGSDEAPMPGVRKALQTMEAFTSPPTGLGLKMPASSARADFLISRQAAFQGFGGVFGGQSGNVEFDLPIGLGTQQPVFCA